MRKCVASDVRDSGEAQALMFGLKTLYMYTNRAALVVSVLFYPETTSDYRNGLEVSKLQEV